MLTEELLPELSAEATNREDSFALKNNEKQTIIDVLKECEGNRTKAAKQLGISRRGLYNKLKEYGLE
jgi:transcriptional regulator of acetoin/glycerol metabolism